MPRKDYKKYFMRDKDGGYAGSEPEKEWTEADLQREFGQYQDMPLRSIPGGQEFGEGFIKGAEGQGSADPHTSATSPGSPTSSATATGMYANFPQWIPPDWRRG